MNIRELSIKEQKMIENAPFPYNKPELLAPYRKKDLVLIDDQCLGILGEIDFKSIQKHYRSLGKEPVIICLPVN
ncbi:MAG TPA: hypothetical protein V6C58_18970 [Allocoleopsis sp.]